LRWKLASLIAMAVTVSVTLPAQTMTIHTIEMTCPYDGNAAKLAEFQRELVAKRDIGIHMMSKALRRPRQ
jgi:hypothetical protein